MAAADSPLTAAIEQCLCLARIAESLGLVLNEVRRALFVLEGALDHFIDHLYTRSLARPTARALSRQRWPLKHSTIISAALIKLMHSKYINR